MTKLISLSRGHLSDKSMLCISRTDPGKSLFKRKSRRGGRLNLYPYIIYENHTLICQNEVVPLSSMCRVAYETNKTQPQCTLLGTNDKVTLSDT